MKMSAIKRPRLDVAKINELSDNAGHRVHNTGRKSIQVTHHAPQMNNSSNNSPSNNHNNKKKQVNFSTLGRKGDPRMHLAMIARLKKPSMSLQDALEQGGFEFVKSKNGEMMDTDNVQLRQRKNQLSRRLRLHRNQAKEAVRGDNVNDQNFGDMKIERLPQDRKDSENVGNNILLNAPLTTSIFTTNPSLSVKADTCQVTPALEKNSPYNRIDGSSSPKAAARLDGMLLTKSISDHFGNEPQHTQMQQQSRIQQNPPLKTPEWGKMESALENFRIDASSLLKSCMLKAGFSHGDTDECDEAYLAFSELALGKELERLSRIRFRMGHRSSTSSTAIPLANTTMNGTALTNSAHSSNQRHGIGANSNQMSWQGNEQLLQSAQEQSHHNHDRMHSNHPNQKNHEQSHHNHHSHDQIHNNHQNQKAHEHSPRSYDHTTSHDHMHKSHHNDFNLNGILSSTDHQDHARTEGCIYSRHRHLLDGNCGHKAILHRPLDGAPHVDFIVDGKVECYQDMPLKTACWPSRFKNTELPAPGDNPTTVQRNRDKCDATCREACREGKPPKLLSLDELNFDGEEWFRDFDSESAAGAGTAAALDSFMKLSGLDTV